MPGRFGRAPQWPVIRAFIPWDRFASIPEVARAAQSGTGRRWSAHNIGLILHWAEKQGFVDIHFAKVQNRGNHWRSLYRLRPPQAEAVLGGGR